MSIKRRVATRPEQDRWNLQSADATLKAGGELATVMQAIQISESTYDRRQSSMAEVNAEVVTRCFETPFPRDSTLPLA